MNIFDKNFKEILNGSILAFISGVFIIILGFLSNFLIANYYGAEVLGSVTLIISFLSISSLFSIFGFQTVLLKLIPATIKKNSFRNAKKLFKKCLNIVFGLTLVVALVSFFFVDWLAVHIYKNKGSIEWLYLAIFGVFFYNLLLITIIGLRSIKKVKVFAILQTLQPLMFFLGLVLNIYFLNINLAPVYIYIFSYIPSSVIALTLLFKYFAISIKGEVANKSIDKEYSNYSLLNLSFPFFLTSAMWLVISQTDIVMLGYLTNTVNVGIYVVAVKIATLSVFILNSINIIIAPKISELYAQGKQAELKNVIQKTAKLIFLTTIPISIVLMSFGDIFLLYFGNEFTIGYITLVLIVSGQTINAITGPTGYFLSMTGNHKFLSFVSILSASVNILLNIILIPKFGINGAATATFISLLISNVVPFIYIKSKFGYSIGYLPILSERSINKIIQD